jgi:hypothetical protein
VEQGTLALDTQKGSEPDGISPLRRLCWLYKNRLLFCLTCRCFLGFCYACGRSCTLSLYISYYLGISVLSAITKLLENHQSLISSMVLLVVVLR